MTLSRHIQPYAVLLWACLAMLFASEKAYAQFNNGYNFRMPIGVSESMVPDGSALSNFVLYVDVTSAQLATSASKVTSSQGYDILIADSLGNTLDYELIAYNGTTGRYQAWVRLPTLSDVDTTVLYLYYGNSLVTANPSVTATWSSDFLIVDHMESGGAANTVSGGVSPSADNTSAGTGWINGARSFNGTSQSVTYPHGTTTNRTGNFTVSLWMNSTNSGSSPDLVNKWASNNGYIFNLSGNDILMKNDKSSMGSSANAITDNAWFHVAATWDATNGRALYINGVAVKTDNKTAGPSSTTTPLTFSSSANPYAGLMDEVRLTNTPRTANWIAAEYNNQSSPATYLTLGPEECSSITYYSYLSGDFHTATIWTTDPSGQALTNPAIPTSCDNIVVLSGRTITVSSNNVEIDGVTVNSGGTLDFGTTQGHSIGPVAGSGVLKIRSFQLPTGDYTSLGSASGGTLQLVDAGTGTFPASVSEWNHVQLLSTNATADNITLGSDVTLNGNLTLSASSGSVDFIFGDGLTSRSLTVTGDVMVGASTRLSVNAASAIHTFALSGSLTSNGTVDLSNGAQYATSTTGAVELTLTGESDEVITGSGSQLDLYRLILNKGVDNQWVVSVNHPAFALYGPTNLANGSTTTPYSASNPEITKALWLRAGTLKLLSGVSVPELTSGGDHFTIPEFGALWIDGADVTSVRSTGSAINTGLLVHGTFRISSGTFGSNQSSGVLYGGTGSLDVSGGEVNISQLRPMDGLTAGTNGFTYTQSGGQFICRGDAEVAGAVDVNYALFDLGFSSSAYTHSGGQIVLRDISANTDTGGFYIGVNPPNASVSGGLYHFDLPSGTSAYLNSTVDVPRVRISRRSGVGTATVIAGSSLTINDTLDIQSDAAFVGNSENIRLEGALRVSGTLTPGAGRWTASGTGSRNWNITGATGSFADLYVVLGTNDSLTLSGVAQVAVADTLGVSSGIAHLSGTAVQVQSTFVNSGTTRGSSAIVFNGGSSFNWGGSGSGITHAVEISGLTASSSSVTLTSDQYLRSQLTYSAGNANTNRLLALSSFNLTLHASVTVSGVGANGTGASGVLAGGLASDGGLTWEVSQLSTSFPFVESGQYAPAVLTLSQTPSSYGSVTVVKVNSEHPNVTESGFSLTTYWSVSSTITLGSASADWDFQYLDAQVQGSEADYTEAYFSGLFWSYGGTGDVNTATNNLNFSGFNYNTQIAGQYTAGDTTNAQPFGAVEIYYSRQSGAWSNAATWSLKGHNLDSVPSVKPQPNSIVIIGDNDSIWTAANGEAAGALTIESGAALDIQSNTGHVFGTVAGSGSLRMMQGTLPGGELSDFLGASGGTVVIYTRGSNVSFSGIDISCRKMKWVIETSNRMGLGGQVTVAEDLIVRSLVNFGQEVRLEGIDVTVGGDIDIYEGQFTFRNGSGASNFDIGGDWRMRSNATALLDQNSDVVHQFHIGDSLLLDGAFDMYNTATQYAEITFDGTGVAALTGAATAELYRITIDKGSDTTSQFWLSHSGALTFQNTSWLVLNNGLFVYNRNDTRTVSSSASALSIPSTAGIQMAASGGVLNLITSSTNTADLNLSGALISTAGTINVGLAANNSGNDIIYASTGTPVIRINGGNLFVNGQIRRNTSSTQGSLNMEVSAGGTVTIGGKATTGTRGKLEIANSGQLVLSGNANLVFQRGGATDISDLYLTGGNSDLSGGTITFQTGTGASTAEETFKMNVDVPLNHLVITGASGDAATLKLISNGITIAGDLTVSNAFSTFHTNGLNVSISGDLYLQGNGVWTGSTLTVAANSNYTGTASGSSALNNLTISSGNTLSFLTSSTLTVGGTLTLASSSSIDLGTGSISALGTVNLGGNVVSDAASSSNGFYLAGTSSQTISGAGTIDNLIVNNASHVNVASDFQVVKQLHFSAGRLLIADHRLTLSTDAVLSGTFSSTKMISTNGLLTDEGVHYNLSAGPKNILLPVGSNGKYAPARYNFSSLTSSGTIQLVPVDAPHPGTTDTANTQLDYYWYVTSSGLGTFTVSHQYQYNGADVNGTEGNYVAGHYNVVNWEPTDGIPNSVDPTNDTITLFQVDYLDGEFTAGEAGEFGEAPTFYSRSGSGFHNWDDPNAWSNDSHGGVAASIAPSGTGKIVIAEGDSIATNGDLRVCQSVRNYGTLYLGSTYGHNFGRFNGTGKVVMDVSPSNIYIAPAGIYSGFVSDTGGTWVYTGSVDAQILNGFSTYENLTFTGSSTKDLGSQNLTIYGHFAIRGGAVANTNNINLDVRGDWINSVGTTGFDAGTGTVQFSGGTSTISGSTRFNNVQVNTTNPADSLVLTAGRTTVLGTHTETSGVLALAGGDVEFRGNVTNGTWYSNGASSITLAGSGSVSNGLPFADGRPQLDSLTVSRSVALALTSDLAVNGALTLGAENFSMGSNVLTIQNPLAGTTASLQSNNTSTLEVTGTGSGISTPSSISALKTLKVSNPNGLVLEASVAVSDTIVASAGDIDANGNVLSLANEGWVDIDAGYLVENIIYSGNGNVRWTNSSAQVTGGELPSNRSVIQVAKISGTGVLTLNSDLSVNDSLYLNGPLHLGTDSLVLFGTYTGSGQLQSIGGGKLVWRGSGSLDLPLFSSTDYTLDALVIDRTGTHALRSDLVVANDLALVDGYLELDVNNLTTGGSIQILSPSASSFIATSSTGELIQNVPTVGTYTFPVGDLTGTAEYAPLSVNITALTTADQPRLSLRTVDAAGVSCGGSTDYITRYWDVAAIDLSEVEGTVTMHYVDADIVGTEAHIVGKRYNGTYCVNGDSALVANNTISVFIEEFGEFTGREIDIATEPSNASTTLVFSRIDVLELDLGWTSGDGQQRLVVAREGSAVSFDPEDYHHYGYNTQFGTSTDLGGGQYVVYRGGDASVSITGLSSNKTYYFEVFEFNKQDTISENYLTSSTLADNQNTAVQFDLIVLMEGPLDTVSGQMSTALQTKGLLPLSQPFSSLYAGIESVPSVPLGISDWVFVQFYDAPTEADVTAGNLIHEGAFFLKSNGQIVDMDGTSLPVVVPSREGALRPVIQSRNHLIFAAADLFVNVSDVHALDTRVNGGMSTVATNEANGWKVVPVGQVEGTTPYAIDQPDADLVWNLRNTTNVYRIEDLNWDGHVNATDRALIFWNIGKAAVLP